MYRKSTLRKMLPVTRKLARLRGEVASVDRRLKKVIEEVSSIELDSQALWKIHQAEDKGEVTGKGMKELDRQMLSKATKEVPF